MLDKNTQNVNYKIAKQIYSNSSFTVVNGDTGLAEITIHEAPGGKGILGCFDCDYVNVQADFNNLMEVIPKVSVLELDGAFVAKYKDSEAFGESYSEAVCNLVANNDFRNTYGWKFEVIQ